MGKTIQSYKYLSDAELIKQLHQGAELYSKFANTYLLFLYKKNKSDVYEMYEVYYGEGNFMHLAGIRSKTLNAVDFYKGCLSGIICKCDCTPKNSITNMYEKVSIITEMLNLKYGKCYKIGEKNLVTRDNDFEMATGNGIGVIGYDSRISKSGSKQVNKSSKPIPTTLLSNPITKYCSSPNKIIFILQKSEANQHYSEIFFEIKKNLLIQEYPTLPQEIKRMINVTS